LPNIKFKIGFPRFTRKRTEGKWMPSKENYGDAIVSI